MLWDVQPGAGVLYSQGAVVMYSQGVAVIYSQGAVVIYSQGAVMGQPRFCGSLARCWYKLLGDGIMRWCCGNCWPKLLKGLGVMAWVN